MAGTIETRIALRGDISDINKKFNELKGKSDKTSADIKKGFEGTAKPLGDMGSLLGDNNNIMSKLSGSVGTLGSSLAKVAVANPALLLITGSIAALKIAYEEVQRSMEDYTMHTEAGIVSVQAHNKALDEAVSVTRRLKEERSGLGEQAEGIRQDIEKSKEIYKAGTTFWEKVKDGFNLMTGNYAQVGLDNMNRGFGESLKVYDKVKVAQTELIENERAWLRVGKLRVEDIRTESKEQLLAANDKTLSDEIRRKALDKYTALIAEAYSVENTYLKRRAELIVTSNEDSADDLETIRSISDAQLALNQNTNAYTKERRKALAIDYELLNSMTEKPPPVPVQIEPFILPVDTGYYDEMVEDLEIVDAVIEKNADLSESFSQLGYGIEAAMTASSESWGQWAIGLMKSAPQLMTAFKTLGLVQRQEATKNIVANQAESLSGAAKSGSALPFPLNIAAIAASIATVVGIFSSIPKFADGGIVGGTSTYGDKILARVNSGEVILNREQQASLYSQMEGGGSQTVKLIAKGGDLIGVIDYNNRKTKSFGG